MAGSLRVNLLRLLIPPVAVILAVGSIAAYYLSIDPAADAYDQSLINTAIALSERIRVQEGGLVFDLPSAAEAVVRTDKYDKIYYVVRDPNGEALAGDQEIPRPPRGVLADEGVITFDADYRGQRLRVAALLVPCGTGICTVTVAETTIKRERLARDILLGSVLPQTLFAVLTLVLVWFGVRRGLAPLARLSDEILDRSPRDLRPINERGAPAEAKPLVAALNKLFDQVDEANRNQQRFLANAAHQLRTPLAGLQAHTELAMAQPVPEACRAELEFVHSATIRTARLANQLLALARAEPGGNRPSEFTRIDLRQVVEECADEWVHRSLAKDVDLGFDLAPAGVAGDAFLLRELLVNLVGNAVEYTPKGGHVTVRTGAAGDASAGGAFLEVEDDGPGIPAAERERVLERFYRLPGTVGTGSGLGLAIVREIALAHGARVEIGAGQGGRGCCVRLIFPATAPILKDTA
ncbi:MAG: sensor histidine kinase N-terminal domain-containing protein [Proteobacteria bacterium]|nr:sensor histidine kinase N-terminal domain-containing protein [Pseudomonadota bacterium]